MVLKFGVFTCTRKTHTESKDKDDSYKLVFKDDEGGQISLTVEKRDYENINVGSFLPWDIVQRQTTLEKGKHQNDS